MKLKTIIAILLFAMFLQACDLTNQCGGEFLMAQPLQYNPPPNLPRPGVDDRKTYDRQMKEWRQQRNVIDRVNRNTWEINQRKQRELYR